MFEKMPHIKDKVYLDFLGRTVDFHWNYHAILGSLTVTLGVIQLLFGMLRGSHGGKYYNKEREFL